MHEESDRMATMAVVFRHDDTMSQRWNLPVGPVRQELACVYQYGAWEVAYSGPSFSVSGLYLQPALAVLKKYYRFAQMWQ